ncbi:hypothetical protein JQX13_26500 [Archangium violaceum]|uniref:hypothetical protein n=1 Tax=Archangium violaceum TaxID=83451 RepID=UPI00193B66CD|nr:hypothetical protein [Archangium violaceum]QRK13268.1 hypothetical protein JQX13_26500 [Archangium violaceum]
MSPPPSKPKVPTTGVPLGADDDSPTVVEPRRLMLPRAPVRSRGDDFEDVPTNPGRPPFARPGTSPRMPDLNGETTSPGSPAFTGVAPEVRQSRWHDRSAAPRGVLPAEVISKGLDEALQKAARAKAPVGATREQLKTDWLPLLRQVVEQTGGDGLDVYVTQLLSPPGRTAMTPLVDDLAAGMERLNAALDAPSLLAVARELQAVVARALGELAPRAISLDLQERELDGRVDVDMLLFIRFASNAELSERRSHAGKTLEDLRQQMRALSGMQPGGLFSSFARVKVEKRVMDAEARRRGGS